MGLVVQGGIPIPDKKFHEHSEKFMEKQALTKKVSVPPKNYMPGIDWMKYFDEMPALIAFRPPFCVSITKMRQKISLWNHGSDGTIHTFTSKKGEVFLCKTI